jgi:transcriptional regulator with XRE-family HTH domain
MQYNRIKDLREDRDASQRQVAESLGLYTTTYARYERGEQEVPFCIAIALAKFYNVSLDYLAGLTNEPRKLV